MAAVLAAAQAARPAYLRYATISAPYLDNWVLKSTQPAKKFWQSRGVGDRDPSKAEQESERNSRRLLELLQEVRVATAGVQILFGFLLAVPFQQGFERISSFQRHVYLVVLVCTSAFSRIRRSRSSRSEVVRVRTLRM